MLKANFVSDITDDQAQDLDEELVNAPQIPDERIDKHTKAKERDAKRSQIDKCHNLQILNYIQTECLPKGMEIPEVLQMQLESGRPLEYSEYADLTVKITGTIKQRSVLYLNGEKVTPVIDDKKRVEKKTGRALAPEDEARGITAYSMRKHFVSMYKDQLQLYPLIVDLSGLATPVPVINPESNASIAASVDSLAAQPNVQLQPTIVQATVLQSDIKLYYFDGMPFRSKTFQVRGNRYFNQAGEELITAQEKELIEKFFEASKVDFIKCFYRERDQYSREKLREHMDRYKVDMPDELKSFFERSDQAANPSISLSMKVIPKTLTPVEQQAFNERLAQTQKAFASTKKHGLFAEFPRPKEHTRPAKKRQKKDNGKTSEVINLVDSEVQNTRSSQNVGVPPAPEFTVPYSSILFPTYNPNLETMGVLGLPRPPLMHPYQNSFNHNLGYVPSPVDSYLNFLPNTSEVNTMNNLFYYAPTEQPNFYSPEQHSEKNTFLTDEEERIFNSKS